MHCINEVNNELSLSLHFLSHFRWLWVTNCILITFLSFIISPYGWREVSTAKLEQKLLHVVEKISTWTSLTLDGTTGYFNRQDTLPTSVGVSYAWTCCSLTSVLLYHFPIILLLRYSFSLFFFFSEGQCDISHARYHHTTGKNQYLLLSWSLFVIWKIKFFFSITFQWFKSILQPSASVVLLVRCHISLLFTLMRMDLFIKKFSKTWQWNLVIVPEVAFSFRCDKQAAQGLIQVQMQSHETLLIVLIGTLSWYLDPGFNLLSLDWSRHLLLMHKTIWFSNDDNCVYTSHFNLN